MKQTQTITVSVEETEEAQRGIVSSQTGLLISCAHYKNLYDKVKALQEILKEWKRNNNASAEKLGIPESKPSHKVKLHWRKVGGRRAKKLSEIQRELAQDSPALMALLDLAKDIYDSQPVEGGSRTLVVKHNPDYNP